MADTTINVRVKNKYDTEANWTSKNPVLLLGEIAVSSDKNSKYKVGDGKSTWSQLKYAYQADLDTKLPISGGTMTGALNLANNTWNKIGDDCYLGDHNQGGCVCIKGMNGSTGLYFEPYSGSTSQKLSINGSGTMNVTENFSVAKNLNVGGQITGNTYASYLQWGGKNLAGIVSPVDAALNSDFSANRLAFMQPSDIVVEYSRDSGSTWTNYGVSDTTKISLTTKDTCLSIGGHESGITIKDQLRVTLTASTGNLYTLLRQFQLRVSTNGASGSYVTLLGRKTENYNNNVDSWDTLINKQSIDGWSGWNVLNYKLTFGEYSGQTTGHYHQLRFVFGIDALSSNVNHSNNLKLFAMRAYGENIWSSTNEYQRSGHIYTFDTAQNVTFPATVTAPNLSVSGSIRNLDHHGGGIFWNPYVESDTDSSDAASITVIKDGNGTNGTVLQIKQANDTADIVNVVTTSNDGLKVNKNTVLTAANYNNYKPSTAGTADYANLLNLHATSSTVTTGKSTWRNGVTTGTIVWGQWWKDTSLTNDTGDVCLWLEKSGSQTILNAIIDGYIRAGGGFRGDLSGNASTSTKLATARKINGVSFDGSGDITVGVDPANIADGYTKNSFYINTHPENNPTVIPFINNDIAFLLKRGGSAVVKYDDVIQNVDISNVFDGSPSYWSIGSVDTTSVKTITMELTLHKVFNYTNIIYVDFGCYSFRAKDIKFEVMNSNYPDDVWTQRGIITDNPCGEYKVIMSHTPVGSTSGAGGGFNKIKFTFTNFNRSGVNAFRIACLGVINCGSSGIREICLPKDGGSLYGGIYPYSNKGATLGTSSNQWSNVYTDTVTASGNVTVGGNLTVTGTVSGTANKAVALTSSAGSTTNPVYFSGGKPYACGYTINTSVPSGAVFTDKNTRQYPIANLSTETNWRPLLMGNSSSATEGFTPSDVTNMCLTASNLSVQPSTGTVKANIFKGEEVKLSDKCTLKYDSTEECVSFVFG